VGSEAPRLAVIQPVETRCLNEPDRVGAPVTLSGR
jgi:hypothetical protein